ncbi:phospholipase A2 [Amycolatopsis minnesotensis]|uniref:phospholipase A2 n=1 Tax=Amycolatopsis minnesotensis TaxID=337894 RepID=UPI0031E05294
MKNSIARRAAVVVCTAAAVVCSVAVPASAAGAPSAKDLMFEYSLDDFLKVSASKPGPYNWNTDKCSVPKEVKIGPYSGKQIVDAWFTDQCVRHDFGYRNNHRIPVGKGTGWADRSALRAAIDKKLHSDMDDRCGRYSHFNPLRQPCFGASDVVYQAVRRFGGGAFK